jgi:hypothetical protein
MESHRRLTESYSNVWVNPAIPLPPGELGRRFRAASLVSEDFRATPFTRIPNLRRAAGVPQSSGLAEVSLGIILLFLFLLFWAHTRLLVPSNLSNLLLAWHL